MKNNEDQRKLLGKMRKKKKIKKRPMTLYIKTEFKKGNINHIQ